MEIFFNAHGVIDDVSDELKAFLDYLAGKTDERRAHFKDAFQRLFCGGNCRFI